VFFGKNVRFVAGVVFGLLAGGFVSAAESERGEWDLSRRQPAPEAPLAWDAPDCMDDDRRPLDVDNNQVIQWKAKTPNQFKARANVQGEVIRLFADRNSHDHFEIKIGPNPKDVLEVIYNKSFGELRDVNVGMKVQACGDYITSIAPSGPYPASPSGAIIHWVHFNPREGGHPHGYLIIEGELFGDDIEMANRRDSRRGGRHGFQTDWSQLATGSMFPLFAQ
jgi:hypothetical protein